MTSPILPQQQRENPEPKEGSNPMPWFVIVLTALLMAFGVLYIARSAIINAPALGDGRSTAELQGALPAAAGTTVDGTAAYASRCAACHQASGAGLPGVFPPLDGSEWVQGEPRVLANILLHGITGEITVKGNKYQGAMPAFPQLSDAELAGIASFIRGNWSNKAEPLQAELFAKERADGSRTTPFEGEAALKALSP